MAQTTVKKKPTAAKRVRRGALAMMIRPKTDDANEDDAQSSVASAKAKETDALALAVGKEIRSLRLSLNLAANALAEAAGLSNGMLSKIESGQSTPSFATLLALSSVLKVPVARLFASHNTHADYSLVRAGKGIDVQRRGSKTGFNYQLLGHLLSGEKYAEPYLVTISDTASPSPGFQHTGLEFMYILEGSMIYRYADTLVELHPGDTMVFDANSIHGHERLLTSPVRHLSVVFNLRA
ncbi:XRE family transcriptional regulator [Bosea sp. OK403]|uniref:helix-turn-helix domain-containing protein n=1 Tax=Bosea sp. OK403 TaxID=1855286 RepID=UPI0015874B46|nr:XRE family transcriptional regulator [Bosea sp. OK403]